MTTPHPIKEKAQWSYPRVAGGGIVWFGFFRCTREHVATLREKIEGHEDLDDRDLVDDLSLVGRYHPEWTTAWNERTGNTPRAGGQGSRPFEAQYCGTGVWFTKEPIWHFHRGELTWGVPKNCGAFHRRYDGDGFTQWSGPEPGSQAAEILGKTAYHYDEDLGLYYAGPDKIEPWWR